MLWLLHALSPRRSIYDKLSNERLAQLIWSQFHAAADPLRVDPAHVATALVEASLHAGSRDNMSAIVVQYVPLSPGASLHSPSLHHAVVVTFFPSQLFGWLQLWK
jgi:hypothetical protein